MTIIPTATHWGNFLVESNGGRIEAVHPNGVDPNPSAIGQSLLDAQHAGARIARPAIRKGYLDKQWQADGSGRGLEPFVEVPWDEALDIAAAALHHVRRQHGNKAIYGGSYGWASAGRFHHAQSQIHRFLNCIGGYVRSVNTYSAAAAECIVPRIIGMEFYSASTQSPSAEEIIAASRIVLFFGGAALKNTQVNSGGIGQHTAQSQLKKLGQAGAQIVNISPLRDDVMDSLGAQWWPIVPCTDVALMLGLAHTLVEEKLHDRGFLGRYTVGFEQFLVYLLGQQDGVTKDAKWASRITGLAAEDIRDLARKLGAAPSLITIGWSLQRQEHGEQAYWLGTTLAAMLGHIGVRGAGLSYGNGSIHNYGYGGRRPPRFRTASLPQGVNRVRDFIPVARIADMLENPGGEYDFNGHRLRYPDIELIYWAGGNPYHHHQDLNRLRKAWAKPGTVIVNETGWTATARLADIVFPCTSPLERDDYTIGTNDTYITPMRQALPPYGQTRDDYEVFSGLAQRLGCHEAFTEGRTALQWIEHLYNETRASAAETAVSLPPFQAFWQGRQQVFEEQENGREFHLEKFRRDPDYHPLSTPSGKIEIYSQTIAGFGYDDCVGHPRWYEKEEWLGAVRAQTYPLHLISNQPRTKLHSQLDYGVTSRNRKIKGRERVRMNPADAVQRGIKDGDIVVIFNDRGRCLAGVELTDAVRSRVIELPTGAWLDVAGLNLPHRTDGHGNPNVLTLDKGTSKLAQGPIAHSCLVEVALHQGDLPEIAVFEPPLIALR